MSKLVDSSINCFRIESLTQTGLYAMSNVAPAPQQQPAIFTLYAWHPLEGGCRELKTHLIAAHSSEQAEQFIRKHRPDLMEGAECFISTDFLLEHLDGFGACHSYSNLVKKGAFLYPGEFNRWVATVTQEQNEDGEISPATVRPLCVN